jgi:hypothetical protein
MQMYLNLRYFDLSPAGIGLPPSPHAIGQKKASPHSLVFGRSDPPVQYLNNRSHGQHLMSTPGQAEVITQYFFKKSTTEHPPIHFNSRLLFPMFNDDIYVG